MTIPTPPLTGTGQTIRIPGPSGWIEAAIDPAEAPKRAAICIVCHPLPTEGGTMHNKVVTTVARALRESGVTTLRFNFRGVGQSDGTFDNGEGELDDLRAVARWARAQHPGRVLWLAGFSFGAWVSLRAARELDATALVSIAPPVGRSWAFAGLLPPPIPWLVIQGEADEIVAPRAVFDWLATLPRQPQQVRMPETSHFFHRKLIDLRDAVKQAVRDWPPLPHD